MSVDRESSCCMAHGDDWLAAYVQDELPDSDAAQLERHVLSCSSCAGRLAEAARFEAALYDLGEAVELELALPGRRFALLGAIAAALASWWNRARPKILTRPSWAPLAMASVMVLVMCDFAAMRGLVDGASPAPGAVAVRSRDAVPLDQQAPGCEEPALVGEPGLRDGPACLEPLAVASMSIEPAFASSFASTFEADFEPADSADACLPDDGGELVCSDDPLAG